MDRDRSASALLAVLDDLEQQAEGLALRERDGMVADLVEGEYAEVSLAARWHASLGHEVRVEVLGGELVRGRVARTGRDWVIMTAEDRRTWVFPFAGVRQVAGLSPRATAEEALGVIRRLPLGSVLRGLLGSVDEVVWHLRDGRRTEGRVRRVGADFVELDAAVVPFGAIAAVVIRP